MHAAAHEVSSHDTAEQCTAWLCMRGTAVSLASLEGGGLLQFAYCQRDSCADARSALGYGHSDLSLQPGSEMQLCFQVMKKVHELQQTDHHAVQPGNADQPQSTKILPPQSVCEICRSSNLTETGPIATADPVPSSTEAASAAVSRRCGRVVVKVPSPSLLPHG